MPLHGAWHKWPRSGPTEPQLCQSQEKSQTCGLVSSWPELLSTSRQNLSNDENSQELYSKYYTAIHCKQVRKEDLHI